MKEVEKSSDLALYHLLILGEQLSLGIGKIKLSGPAIAILAMSTPVLWLFSETHWDEFIAFGSRDCDQRNAQDLFSFLLLALQHNFVFSDQCKNFSGGNFLLLGRPSIPPLHLPKNNSHSTIGISNILIFGLVKPRGEFLLVRWFDLELFRCLKDKYDKNVILRLHWVESVPDRDLFLQNLRGTLVNLGKGSPKQTRKKYRHVHGH